LQRVLQSRAFAFVRASAGRAEFVAVVAILLVGALLRLVDIGRPFASGDHAEVAAVVSFFYPRDAASFSASSPTAVWNLLQNPHGIAPIAIALPWISAVGLLGVTLNEFWWNLPFALLGLCLIPLAYRLGEQLGGRSAGLLCALFAAVLPVHASLSRASGGGSHIAISLVAQVWAVSAALRYFGDPAPASRRRASLAIACAVVTDVLLPALFFLLLAIGVYSVRVERPGLMPRLREARRLLFGTSLLHWPLVALAWPVGLLVLQAAGVINYGGLLARLFSGSDRQPGIRIGNFIENAALNVGPLGLALLALCALATVPALLRFERRGFLLVWSGIYLAPFVLFSRPYVFDFYIAGIAPLVFCAALLCADGLRSGAGARRLAAGLGAAALFALLALRSASMIFGVDMGPLVGSRQAAGAVFPDPGIKAASWWVRAHAPADALVFADAPYEPYQLAYYLHRPFLAATDATTSEEAFGLLDGAERQPDYYLLYPGSEELLRSHAAEQPRLAVTVMVEGRPALLIYQRGAGPPQALDAEAGNRRFDQEFGGWRAMLLRR
jgi:hypothetical protein